jgi:hypothetical protein
MTVLRIVTVWACACLSLCYAQHGVSHSALAAEYRVARLPPVDMRLAEYSNTSLSSPNYVDQDLVDWEEDETNFLPHGCEPQGFRITPYGLLWGNMAYATERTNTGPYTLYVFSEDVQGESAFNLDVRASRIGVDIEGPRIPFGTGLKSVGRLEVDFFGEFVNENSAGLRLRHAYWEVGNDSFRLLFGQNWDVISPLEPGLLNLAAGWFGGNIGFRRAQFRAERYLLPSDNWRVTLQGSLNQDVVPDFPEEPGVRRESAAWPVVEGRVAFTWQGRGAEQLDTTVGISGHIGETGFDFVEAGPPPLDLPPTDNARFLTWSFNVDMRVPITDRFGVQGEFFTGANLSTFLGGIGQGVCPCLRVPIRSTGGWLDVWYDWTPRLHSHAGAGLDDPNNRDLLFGRTYNQFMFANLLFEVTRNLSTGIEVSYWKTLYQELRVGQIPDDELEPSTPGKSVTIDWMVKYEF